MAGRVAVSMCRTKINIRSISAEAVKFQDSLYKGLTQTHSHIFSAFESIKYISFDIIMLVTVETIVDHQKFL